MHFKLPSIGITASLLTLALAVGGCGSTSPGTSSSASATSSSTTTSSSTKPSKAAPPAVPTHPKLHTASGGPLSTTIALGSAGVSSHLVLASQYTCSGTDISPPISWDKLPAHTADLALFLITAGSVNGQLGLISMDWGVANLNPATHGIAAGKVPAGAVVGANDEGKHAYSVCPSKGTTAYYAFLLYALPHRLAVKPGFNARTLRETASSQALAGGVLVSHYHRP